MSTMNGNPHYERAVDLLNVPALENLTPEEEAAIRSEAQVNATLALAFEQRTANLMQFLVDQEGDEARKLWTQVAARLGLNGATS